MLLHIRHEAAYVEYNPNPHGALHQHSAHKMTWQFLTFVNQHAMNHVFHYNKLTCVRKPKGIHQHCTTPPLKNPSPLWSLGG